MTQPTSLKTVVRISSGEVIEVVVERTESSYSSDQIWRPESLKKDGGFPRNRRPDGLMVGGVHSYLAHYAYYDAERETKAQVIRTRRAYLRQQLSSTEDELLALYTTE